MESLKKISQQTLWQLIGKGISAASTIFVLGIISRQFGESGTGIFTLALTYLTFFFLAADLGLNNYVLPRISSDEKEINKLFNFRLAWSILLVIIANILVFFLPFSNPLFNTAVFLGSFSIVFSGVFSSISLVFQKNLRYDQALLASSAGSFTVIPVIWILSIFNLPVYFLILGPLLGWMVNNTVSLLLVKKFYHFKLYEVDLHYPLQTLKSAWPISLTLLFNTVYFRIDAFILSSFHSFADVGIYNFAYQFFQTALVLPTFIMNSYYPLMIKDYQENRNHFNKKLFKALGLMFGLSLVSLIGTFIFAPIFLPIISGGGFSGSVDVLKILSLGFPAYFISAILMWTMMVMKKYKIMMVVYIFGLIFNTALNLIYIPRFSYNAAAYTTIISEYLIVIMLAVVIYRQLHTNR